MSDSAESNIASTANDDSDFHYYGLEMVEKQKNAKAIIYKTPDRVIPVVFLPGVMGSNLLGADNKPLWRLDSTKGTVWDWSMKGEKKLKEQF